MEDIDNMSRSELWSLIKKLNEEGADIDAKWGSKETLLEALKNYYNSLEEVTPIEEEPVDDELPQEDNAPDEEPITEDVEVEFIDEEEEKEEEVCEDADEEEAEEEVEEEISSIDDLIDEKEPEEAPLPIPKPKPAPVAKKPSYTIISHNTDINSVKVGTLVKFRCIFYRGSQNQYITSGLLVKKFGGAVEYVGKLTPVIRNWIRNKRIKVLRWG